MKNWNKYLCLIGLSAITFMSTAVQGYEQPTIYGYTQQTRTIEVPEGPKIYGGVTVKTAYSMMKYPKKTSFSPSLILMGASPDPNSKTALAVSTNLGLEKRILWEGDSIKLVIESGASNEGKASLKKAIAEFKNWMVGWDDSNFDASNSAVQLRWKQQINPILSYVVSIEEAAKFELYPEEKEEKQPNHDIPALTTSLRYNYPNSSGHLYVGGLVRTLAYYHKAEQAYYHSPAFGANVGTDFQLIPEKTTLKGKLVYGQGIGGYIADLALLDKEANTAYLKPNSLALNTIDAWSLGATIEHHWVPKLRSKLAGSLLSTIKDEDRPKEHYKRGIYGSTNLMYHPIEQFHFGVEYSHGLRTNIDDSSVQAGHIQAIASFKF